MSKYEPGDFELVVENPAEAGALRPMARNLLAAKSDHPGVWVRIVAYGTGSTAANTANELRNGKRPGIPAGRWEFRSGQLEDGRYGVWAKYLGDEEGGRESGDHQA